MIRFGGGTITTWIIDLIEQFGYLSIFALIAVENIFPPIPSEVILTFGGFMTTHTSLSKLGVIISATCGSILGASILYAIGSVLNVNKLDGIINNYGSVLGLKSNSMHKAFSIFRRYRYWAVFLCRMIPIVRSLISIPAGMSRMKFWVFLLLTAMGTFIWNTMLVSAGAFLGESWSDVMDFIQVYQEITYIIFILLGVIYAIYLVKKAYKLRNK